MAYRTLNPFTEQVVKEYPFHTPDEVEGALASADAAFCDSTWRNDIDRRLDVLSRLSKLLKENSDELVRTMATEMGKLAREGREEVELCSGIAGYYAENGRDLLKPIPYASPAGGSWRPRLPSAIPS